MTRRNMLTIVAGMVAAVVMSAPAANAQQKAPKPHAFKGKVQKVDAKAKKLVVDGEAVEGWMAAMTMSYGVDKDDVIAKVKEGDEITATVYDGDFTTLHDVKVVTPPKK
jgi:Cu/Ag efflux protein CusF